MEAGQPIVLQPWQVFDLSNSYGWVSQATGARRFKRCYSKRARGNFKSTEKSALCLYHMCGDVMYPPFRPELAKWERDPEVLCAATDRQQALRVFGDAKLMAQSSPEIARRLIIPKSNPVTNRKWGGRMMALSKDTRNKDGAAPSFFVMDEYHAAPDSTIYDIGQNAFGKRPQALLDVITTAGDDAQRKPCFAEEQYAKRVVSGEVEDETYAVYIRELDEGDDPHDEAMWLKANPCLRTQNDYAAYLLDQIRSEHTAAYVSNDPNKIRAFLTRRLDLWQTGSVNRYLDERCMKLAREAMVSREAFAALTDGLECWCGFDLGKRIDLTGAGAVFLLPDGRVGIKGIGFMPENRAAEHERSDRVPYIAWAKGGYCVLTPGDVTDNGYVDNWISAGEREHRWQVLEVDYDGHNATDLAIRMCEERNREDFCVEIPQTCNGQNLAVKTFRELLLAGKLVIEESPLLLWCMANAIEVVNNFGDIKLSKKHKDDTERIDPLAAIMNALARALVRRNNPTLADRIDEGSWGM